MGQVKKRSGKGKECNRIGALALEEKRSNLKQLKPGNPHSLHSMLERIRDRGRDRSRYKQND